MTPFAMQYADVMSRACGLPVLICDRDHVVAAAGVPKKNFWSAASPASWRS